MPPAKFLFRVYYDGCNYSGFQRQPNGFAIENLMEISIIRSKLITSFSKNKYLSVSRTDAKVSALSNVFGINCLEEPNLYRMNNHFPKDGTLKIWDFALVADDFDVRSSMYKIYAYYFTKLEFDEIIDIERIYQFEGIHNFQSFIKNHGAGLHNYISTIKEIAIEKFHEGYLVVIKGDRFGREQIRRMIGFIIDDKYDKMDPKTNLKSNQKIDIYPAKPESLYLIDIKYNDNPKWNNNIYKNYNSKTSNLQMSEMLTLLRNKYFPE